VTATSAAGTTASVYSGASLLAQVLPGGGTQTYVPGPGQGDTLELTQPGGTQDYYLTDALGSTTALTDSTGAVAESYTYTPYGSPSSTRAVSNPLTFTGQQLDPNGLYYIHGRYYDPTTERFISPDPAPSSNGYTYEADDPLNLTDAAGAGLAEAAVTPDFVQAQPPFAQVLADGISDHVVTCAGAGLAPGAEANLACSPDLLDTRNISPELQAGDFGIG
jgi:RHS repeat-associated protein